MAASYSVKYDTVFGNMRVQLAEFGIADGPTSSVFTGMEWVYQCQATVQTASDDGTGVVINTDASAAGHIKLQSGVSGGIYHVLVFGR